MTRRPRIPNNEPSAIATTDLDLDLGDEFTPAVDEAIMGSCKVGVGDGEEE
jgi:hypothetical protein